MHTNLKVIKEGYYFWSILLMDRPLITIYKILHLLGTKNFKPFKIKVQLEHVEAYLDPHDGDVLRK